MKHQLHLDQIGSICTDGAPAILSNRSGFAALLRKEIPNLKITHCFLHRHALAAKTLPLKLKKALETCVKVVNTICGRALNHRLFQLFCKELGKEQTVLLYYTEVRWVAHGCVLSHLFELRDKIKEFLCKMRNEMAEYFEDPEFIQNLAYLADVFTALNELNRSLQGQGIKVIHACEKLSAFKEKLQLCIRRVKKGNLVNFSSLQETLEESASLHPPLVSTIAEHLQILSTAFDGYFSCGEIQTCDYWIRHPFKVNLEKINDNSDIIEDLIDMRNNTRIKMEFSDDSLKNFWASQLETYLVLAKKAHLLCWCLSQQLICMKQDFLAWFTLKQNLEIVWILSTTCE